MAPTVPGKIRPDLIFHPRLRFVADPAGFTRKHQRGFAVERDENINVAVNNFEPRGVQDRAFEPRVLIAAYDEGVEVVLLHPRADILVPTFDFLLTWQ